MDPDKASIGEKNLLSLVSQDVKYQMSRKYKIDVKYGWKMLQSVIYVL